MFADTYWLTTDPVRPWSTPGVGLWLLAAIAAVLVALTVWTYLGNVRAGWRRVSILIGLRLGALLLVVFALVRPSLASRDNPKLPSVLLILLDGSESMTIQDELNNQSRWDALRRTFGKCDTTLNQLRDEQNVAVHTFRFAEGLGDYDPQGKADGKRTDFGEALHALFEKYGSERHLRGVLIVSDGADNGTRYLATAEAEKWRSVSCQVSTFSVGQTTTTSKQRDIIVQSITPEPQPVPIKGKLTVKALIDAPGFENALARIRLLIDDKEVSVKDAILTQATGNDVRMETTAPDKPGEIKVTLKVDKLFGEVSEANNEMTTYVTVVKEGLSVLYVEGKFRAWEPTFIRQALKDPRIRLDTIVRVTDDRLTAEEAEVFQFQKQPYDVIILGDISARRLSGGDSAILQAIQDQVRRGTGLMMIGGYETFGNKNMDGTFSWKGTPIADVLPVDLSEDGQEERPIQMLPTASGLDRYVMRLADKVADNEAVWAKLPKMTGITRMGKPKPGAVVVARANDAKDGLPLLVSHTFGEGRTLAFGGDETWLWTKLGLPKTNEGVVAHARYWKQIVLWLAKQEEASGNVWVKPDARRLAAGGKLGFTVGARGKGDEAIADARFEVVVANSQGVESTVQITKEPEGDRGTFWKTEAPGEYKLTVRAYVKEDGKERKMDEEATVRFLVYQDTTELARQAADHTFLAKLASAGGGKAQRLEELPRFLQELKSQPLPQARRPKTELSPDWNRKPPRGAGVGTQLNALAGSGMLGTFLLFVMLIGVEWLLRRLWGLV
ncbi:MAG: glutamine amidotransferase [Gemmataceae bacterium]|nr:glutamine amidotransferase [Gemmataceae bacterium]